MKKNCHNCRHDGTDGPGSCGAIGKPGVLAWSEAHCVGANNYPAEGADGCPGFAPREAPPEEHTPYQRGNRDALLAFAVECQAEADRASAEADRWERSRHGQGPRLAENCRFRSTAWSNAAALAKRRAEALPEDPLAAIDAAELALTGIRVPTPEPE